MNYKMEIDDYYCNIYSRFSSFLDLNLFLINLVDKCRRDIHWKNRKIDNKLRRLIAEIFNNWKKKNYRSMSYKNFIEDKMTGRVNAYSLVRLWGIFVKISKKNTQIHWRSQIRRNFWMFSDKIREEISQLKMFSPKLSI